jgi:transposase InsO family protein
MRFQRNRWEGLVDESTRPHMIHRLPEATIHRIVEIRQQEGWCHEAITAYLNQQEGIKVSSGSAYTTLKRNGLITKSYKPRKRRTFIRFSRQHPDSLWQTDIKYYGQQYLIAFLDDCSRYIPAATLSPESTTDTVLETLEEALSAGRVPKQILSDHGTQYWSNDDPGRFTNFCTQHGIEHILGSTGKPTTQEKIERFWQTFELYYPRYNDIDHYREAYKHNLTEALTTKHQLKSTSLAVRHVIDSRTPRVRRTTFIGQCPDTDRPYVLEGRLEINEVIRSSSPKEGSSEPVSPAHQP